MYVEDQLAEGSSDFEGSSELKINLRRLLVGAERDDSDSRPIGSVLEGYNRVSGTDVLR